MKIHIIQGSKAEKIIELLTENLELSISDLARMLKIYHRLVLTGYLEALEDIGLLESRKLGTAKVYKLKNKTRIKIIK